MVWNSNHRELVLYHGTDLNSAHQIQQTGIDLQYCQKLTDFGQGFYTTTYLHQAKNWANIRCKRLNRKKSLQPSLAAVLEIKIPYDDIARLNTLSFVTEGRSTQSDYWQLIRNCRRGKQHYFLPHSNIYEYYDVVFGPVSLWPQTLIVKDCDQISFHTDYGIKYLRVAGIPYQCNASNRLFSI